MNRTPVKIFKSTNLGMPNNWIGSNKTNAGDINTQSVIPQDILPMADPVPSPPTLFGANVAPMDYGSAEGTCKEVLGYTKVLQPRVGMDYTTSRLNPFIPQKTQPVVRKQDM